MRSDVIEYIYGKEDLKLFLRDQPEWYRTLSRNPNELEKFEIASINHFQKNDPAQGSKIFKWCPDGFHDDQYVSINE